MTKSFWGSHRHPLEVTSDRLRDHLEKYEFDGSARDKISQIIYLLDLMAAAEEKAQP